MNQTNSDEIQTLKETIYKSNNTAKYAKKIQIFMIQFYKYLNDSSAPVIKEIFIKITQVEHYQIYRVVLLLNLNTKKD